MYLCLCNALTDRQLKQAADDPASNRPSDVYERCGCRAQCGQCVRAVLALLQDAAGTAQLQGAD